MAKVIKSNALGCCKN